ncbi:hypothetical protein LPJ75_006037 [Coemansia sp. RSA 2598]|nr:hypothetical protein LPJ75_006037 [Coemansia sp. RSA 2598]
MKFFTVFAIAATVATAVSAAPSPAHKSNSGKLATFHESQPEGWGAHGAPAFVRRNQAENTGKPVARPNEAQRRGIDFYYPYIGH